MDDAARSNPGRLALGITALLLVGFVSFSVHVLLQQVAGVPYPQVAAVPTWLKLLRPAGEWAALVAICQLAKTTLARWPVWLRIIVLAMVYAAAKETIRGNVMAGVVTTAYLYNLANIVPAWIIFLVMTALAWVVSGLPGRWWVIVVGGLVLAAGQAFLVTPFVHAAVAPMLARVADMAHDEVYAMPYGIHVLVPAYASYIEPVLGVTALTAISWPVLRGSVVLRVAIIVLLVECLTGELVPPLLWTAYSPLPGAAAFMSTFQFTLEHLVLAAGIALVWHAVLSQRTGRAPRA